jgi:hypothetical protein
LLPVVTAPFFIFAAGPLSPASLPVQDIHAYIELVNLNEFDFVQAYLAATRAPEVLEEAVFYHHLATSKAK